MAGASFKEPPHLPSPRKLKRFVFGAPHDLRDRSIFHRIALIPVLAWIGLGADGLSSSSYGPEEAYRTLGDHTYLALGLVVLVAGTVLLISFAYSRIIEQFPHGGGGYIVAGKLLGKRAGVVSGSALLIDYVLTVAVSIASAGDAIFSFLPVELAGFKFPAELAVIAFLVLMNIRGVKESVLFMAPIFIVFVLTHVVLILGSIVSHAPAVPATVTTVTTSFGADMQSVGIWGILFLLVHAYSMGAGTYTGIEAVSNGLPIMQEPRVKNAKRTMTYMAVSLAFTASGLVLAYLLAGVDVVEGKTMNATLAEKFVGGVPLGFVFVIVTLFSEGALLVAAAQAGFIDGPRVLANMAGDGWMPRRFSALSPRLTTRNGVFVIGVAAIAALIYTGGGVRALVVMYSINVFLTFSLSMLGMLKLRISERRIDLKWKRKATPFLIGFVLCATILGVTVFFKFGEGGWITVLLTGTLVAACFAIQKHYFSTGMRLRRMFAYLEDADVPVESSETVADFQPPLPLDLSRPTAAVLVAGYSGIGINTINSIQHQFPGFFKNIVFISAGVLDAGAIREEHVVEALQEKTQANLEKYVALATGLNMPSTSRFAVGTNPEYEVEKLCMQVISEFDQVTFFAGKLVFMRERWYHHLLHNDFALSLQKRLQKDGIPMILLPVRI
jgi:amino acid transporter